MEQKKISKRSSAEVRERAVSLLREVLKDHASGWAAIQSVASKIGCTSETLRVRTAGIGYGRPSAMAVAATA